jgi:hypothetical protein
MSRLLSEPFLDESATAQQNRRRGLVRVLGWLEQQPGDSWQDRWLASAADAHGNQAWRRLPMHEQAGIGDGEGDSEHIGLNIARAMSMLVCADVLRPSLSWLLTPATPAGLVADLTLVRDPQGFARLAEVGRADGSSTHTTATGVTPDRGHPGRQRRPGRRHHRRGLRAAAAHAGGTPGRPGGA